VVKGRVLEIQLILTGCEGGNHVVEHPIDLKLAMMASRHHAGDIVRRCTST